MTNQIIVSDEDPTAFEEFCRYEKNGRHWEPDKVRRPGRKRECVDTRRDRNRVETRRGRPGGHKDRVAALDREIVGIDGEGGGTNEFGQQNYLLMCASNRDRSYVRQCFNDNKPLTIEQIFEFILWLPENAYICGYYFGYDINMILCRMPELHARLIINRQGGDDEVRGPGTSYSTWFGEYGFATCRTNI
jgi:hypothetical protein